MLCWEGFLDTLVLLNREARVISAEVRLGSGEESRPLEDPERDDHYREEESKPLQLYLLSNSCT